MKNKLYVMPHTRENEQAALRLSKYLDIAYYPRVYDIENGFGIKLIRQVYSGYLTEEVKIRNNAVITVSPKSRLSDRKSVEQFGDIIYLETADEAEKLMNENILKPSETIEKKTVDDLDKAKVVFIGGRGLQSRANYERLKALSEKLGVRCGCTRPVAMNGWESYDNFVGISGHQLNAEICVTFGVSGAGPLVMGLEGVKKLISVNNDPNALIFDYADIGIVDDCLNIIKALEKSE